MAPFFGSSLYTRPRPRRSAEPKTTTLPIVFDSFLPIALHSQSLPNVEQLRGLSANFFEEFTPLLQSRPVVPASSPALPSSSMNKLQDSALTIHESAQALRIVKRSVPGDIADLLPGKGAVGKLKAMRKLIRELNHGIDEIYDSFHQIHYPTSLDHHHSEFSCLFHGYPIKILDDRLDAMREVHYPLEMHIKTLRRDNDALSFENCRLNNLLISIKNAGWRVLYERDRRICELNRFIAAILDVKSNVKIETLEEGKEKPSIDVTMVEAIRSAAKDENTLWATVLSDVIDQHSKRLFVEEIMRGPKLYDELRQSMAKYKLWKVLAQRNPEHATYITPSSSKMSLVPGGNMLQSMKDEEPSAVVRDRNFSAKHPVIESSIFDKCALASTHPSTAALLAQANAILPSSVDPLDATAQTSMPSSSISDLVRALPSVSACSIFSSDTESEEGSVSPSKSDGDRHFAEPSQSRDLDYTDKHFAESPRDAALLASRNSSIDGIHIQSPVPSKEDGTENLSFLDDMTNKAEVIEVIPQGLRQYVDKYPIDGRHRNSVLRDAHESFSPDASMSLQRFERRQIIEVDDQSNLITRDVEPVAILWEERRVPKPNASDSGHSRDSSLLSVVTSFSGNSPKRLSSAGYFIKKSISSGLKHLCRLSLNSPKSPNNTNNQGSSCSVVLHQRQMSNTQDKENLVPKAKQGESGSKIVCLPSQQDLAPSRSRRPTTLSMLKDLTNATPDRLKTEHQKTLLTTDSSTANSPTPSRLPLTSVPAPQSAKQISSSRKSFTTLKRRRRVVHAFGGPFS